MRAVREEQAMMQVVNRETHVEVRHYTEQKRWTISVLLDGKHMLLCSMPVFKNSDDSEGETFAFDEQWAEIMDRIALEWLEARIG